MTYLSKFLAYLIQVNLHPVRIALSVGASDILQKNINKAWHLLEHMCEKESKRPENVNEVSKASKLCRKLLLLSP